MSSEAKGPTGGAAERGRALAVHPDRRPNPLTSTAVPATADA
jgi:hypothetical protein